MRHRAALIAVALVLLGATGWVAYSVSADAGADAGTRAGGPTEELAGRAGTTTTVTGTVESFFPGAFTVGDSTWGDELLVATEGAEVPPVIAQREGRPRVQVTGVVRIKDESLDLVGGEQAEPFQGQPYVQATRIEVIEQISR